MKRPVTIAHIIAGLEPHGAEQFLLRLVKRLPPQFQSHVISLSANGPVGFELERMGVPVEALGMSRAPSSLLRLGSLVGRLMAVEPDIVQTWMYHGDLLGGVAARLAGVRRVAWGIRHGNLRRGENRATTLAVARTCALLSRVVPDVIVSNSRNAQDVHVAYGYDRDRFLVIPNGFDFNRFKPDADARRRIRAELGIGDTSVAIGMVGRFHVQKGHEFLIRAAAGLARRGLDVVFVLAGRGVDQTNQTLGSWIEAAGIGERTRLLGHREDPMGLYPALDILALPSRGEGFPNVLGEAMACGVPAVVTDVGDSSYIVGDTGLVVPPYDSDRLEEALFCMASLNSDERRALGRAARERVVENFDIDAVVTRYARLYETLLDSPAGAVQALGLSHV